MLRGSGTYLFGMDIEHTAADNPVGPGATPRRQRSGPGRSKSPSRDSTCERVEIGPRADRGHALVAARMENDVRHGGREWNGNVSPGVGGSGSAPTPVSDVLPVSDPNARGQGEHRSRKPAFTSQRKGSRTAERRTSVSERARRATSRKRQGKPTVDEVELRPPTPRTRMRGRTGPLPRRPRRRPEAARPSRRQCRSG